MVKSLDDIKTERLKIDIEPVRIQILTDPYIVFGRFGYQVAFDVWHAKKKREYVLLAGALSLSAGIENIKKISESETYIGLEFWAQKEDDSKMSKYVVSD